MAGEVHCSVDCPANEYDVNANPADGCECKNPSNVQIDFPDVSGTDANCDGIVDVSDLGIPEQSRAHAG